MTSLYIRYRWRRQRIGQGRDGCLNRPPAQKPRCFGVHAAGSYLNVDPGTMSPYQHGEVFVTEDGAETDLDLGHYERFTDVALRKENNVTTGQITAGAGKGAPRRLPRRDDQGHPASTNEIKRRIQGQRRGPRRGDRRGGRHRGRHRGLPFFEAVRQLHQQGPGKPQPHGILPCTSPATVPVGSNELKTKPTQHSVRELRSIGIQPDMIICRSDLPVPEREGRALHRRGAAAVVPSVHGQKRLRSAADAGEEGIRGLHRGLELKVTKPDLADWRHLVEKIAQPKATVRIALVGKYVELEDAYMSVNEALRHTSLVAGPRRGDRMGTQDLKPDGLAGWMASWCLAALANGIEGKVAAARYASIASLFRPVPRHAGDVHRVRPPRPRPARRTAPSSIRRRRDPIISLMADQQGIEDMGGTMRLGLWPCDLQAGKPGRGRMRAGDPRCRAAIVTAGSSTIAPARLRPSRRLRFGGLSPDGRLVEIAELDNHLHPWMLGVQFHRDVTAEPAAPVVPCVSASHYRSHVGAGMGQPSGFRLLKHSPVGGGPCRPAAARTFVLIKEVHLQCPGHSKWATIKRKKGADDAKRGQMFTKLALEIGFAARQGPDPNFNFRLRLAVDKAKAEEYAQGQHRPHAIRRGLGLDSDGASIEEVTYEGYGPHGVALYIQVVTDNRNRIVSELRRALTRGGDRSANQEAWPGCSIRKASSRST